MKNTILIVEDESITALDLKFTLEELGYDVVGIADNGKDAINLAAELSPDLTIMDIHLKGEMTGIDASKRLSELNLPCIFLTAYSDDNTFNEVLESSSYGFITKPFNKRTIGLNVDFAIKRSKVDAEKLNMAQGFVKGK
ncbi:MULTISPECIES: response regulator [Methanobrevibacter]|uniref:response regulator n=1 Tax=Methanobrevibacter TaxID=2172 RepID=UPI000334891A|nr:MULTISPECIES: response regulator [Methanobrevibacter]AGN16469.1 response regulator domain-containing protein [Methanobrevibacter sp. AbM4]MDD6257123.1 response regulator [Methanobrevibacter boviskoreani]